MIEKMKIKYGISLSYKPAFWPRCLWSVNWGIKILGAFCLYIIIVIAFDITVLKIGTSVHAESWNSVLLNLSYSIIAAVIFHILVIHFPYFKKKEIYGNRINRQIDYMRSAVFNTCCVDLDYIPVAKDSITDIIKKISLSFKPEYFNTPIRFPEPYDGIMFRGEKVKLDKQNLINVIRLKEKLDVGLETILKYDDYADTKLIDKAVMIKCSTYFHFVDTMTDDSIIYTEKSTYNSFVKSLALTIRIVLFSKNN